MGERVGRQEEKVGKSQDYLRKKNMAWNVLFVAGDSNFRQLQKRGVTREYEKIVYQYQVKHGA